MHANTQTSKTTSSIAKLMDEHLWNEQTEVVDALFPDAEESHPEAARWFELKDSTPRQPKAPASAWRCHPAPWYTCLDWAARRPRSYCI